MVRLKMKWHKQDKSHSLEEEAGVIAYNMWKVAMDAILNLENADYQVEQTPFGYFLDLKVDAPGFSLARVYKEL